MKSGGIATPSQGFRNIDLDIPQQHATLDLAVGMLPECSLDYALMLSWVLVSTDAKATMVVSPNAFDSSSHP